MKTFLLQILSYTCCVALLAIILDPVLSTTIKRHSTDNTYETWNEMLAGDINADLIIMGSSRAWVQYSPLILDSILHINSYNVGFNARSFNGQLMRYKIYREYNTKPKYIIQNIDFLATLGVILSGNRTAIDNVGGQKQFYPYVYDERFMQHITDSLSWAELHIPYYRYYGSAKEILFPSNYNVQQYKGYAPHDLKWQNNNIDSQDSLYFVCYDEVLRMFCDYVQDAIEEGISIIFVYSPPHISVTNRIADMDRMRVTFDSIAQLYNIPVLDYHFVPFASDTSYFYNGTHLNPRGAELFTTILANDLDSLGIVK